MSAGGTRSPADPASPGDSGSDEPTEPRLPESVRQRVVALAADRLATLPPEEIPQALRPFARFTAPRRGRLAAVPIALALEADEEFRERVADTVREAFPELVRHLEAGSALPALPVEEVAAVAYLIRPSGWRGFVAEAAASAEEAEATAARDADVATVARLREQLDAVRSESRAEVERARTEAAAAKAEAVELRRRLGTARDRARQAESESAEELATAQAERAASAAALIAAEAEARRLRARLADAEVALEAARRTARESRGAADVRLRVLLDTVVDAAQGLRRELALPPTTERPADAVAADLGVDAGAAAGVAARGLDPSDRAVVEQLLALPRVHLVIDGYNVTKTGYGGLPLESQRTRLISALGALQARTGAEITCVFDGVDVAGVMPAAPRGVRVLFSPAGQTADELIRRLVGQEPSGRAVVVVSSDREVIDGVRRFGAYAVPSAGLLRVLERG